MTMADDEEKDKAAGGGGPGEEPVVRDRRRIDPETGEVRKPPADEDAQGRDESLPAAEGPDVETSTTDPGAGAPGAQGAGEPLSEEDRQILDDAERDLVAEMRNDMLRAQAELVNFRARVERDRVANREAIIAEVIRSLLPAIDDLDRAEKHGDLAEGSALALVAQKIRAGFEKYGLRAVGEKGERFDPHVHEALVQLPNPEVAEPTVADVIETGYALGERLIRAAKVAVAVPAESE